MEWVIEGVLRVPQSHAFTYKHDSGGTLVSSYLGTVGK